MSHAPSTWTSPTDHSSAFNTPYQPSAPVLDRATSEWSEATSPVIAHAPTHAPAMPMPVNWRNRQNRMSWSGPAKDHEDGEKERKAYHPQAPAKRSDWVMWVGNVYVSLFRLSRRACSRLSVCRLVRRGVKARAWTRVITWTRATTCLTLQPSEHLT